MQFSLLLRILGIKLALSGRFSEAFRKQIRHANCIIVIRTQDTQRARSFSFSGGKVSASGGIHPDFTAELVWCDVPTAMKAMLSKNPLDTFSAIGSGELAIHGNLQDALWFSDLAG